MNHELLATGRLNFTGGGATVTVPKNIALDVFDLDDGGADVAFFDYGNGVIIAPKSEAMMRE